MTNEDIKTVALKNGFKLKVQDDGSLDLNPYVYDFARELAATQNELLFDLLQSHHWVVTKDTEKVVHMTVREVLNILDKNQDRLLGIGDTDD